MRRLSKSQLVRLASPAAPAALRLSSRRIGLALVYHRVAEVPGDARYELVPAVSRAALQAQLAHLVRHYAPVRASELMAAVRARAPGQRIPVAVTFDDDLREHVTFVDPILRAASVPATFFLCGSSLERPFTHWWALLQDAVDRRLLRPDSVPLLPETQVTRALERVPGSIHRLAETVEQLAPAERERLESTLSRLVDGARERNLAAEDVRALVRSGAEIGFHTRRHDVLLGLSPSQLDERLSEGRLHLEGLVGDRLSAVAYPHGKADAVVAEAARRAGFTAGFTGRKEAATVATDPLLIGRLEPRPADSVRDFGAKLARVLLHGWRVAPG